MSRSTHPRPSPTMRSFHNIRTASSAAISATVGKIDSVLLVLLALCLVPSSALIVTGTDGVPHLKQHMTASFGPEPSTYKVSGPLVLADPVEGCAPLNISAKYAVVVMLRGSCTFLSKVLMAQRAGAVGVVVGDNRVEYPALIPMGAPSDAPTDQVVIPAVFVSREDYLDMSFVLTNGGVYNATLDDTGEVSNDANTPASNNLQTIGLLLMILPVVWCGIVGFYYIRKIYRERRDQRARHERTIHLPVQKYQVTSGGSGALASTCTNESCAICLDDFQPGTDVKVLPCSHGFHPHCIDPWLASRSDLCPICKRSILDAPAPPTCCFNVC